MNESGECPTMSDASINVTDATDLDDDENSEGRATWKRVSSTHDIYMQLYLNSRQQQ